MGIFNEALLAKQVWRLMERQNSLCARVMKAKYFPNSSIIEARLGYCPSYLWKSLWGAKSLIIEGTIWRVGIGTSIKVWKDPWLPLENGRFLSTAPPRHDNEMVVAV